MIFVSVTDTELKSVFDQVLTYYVIIFLKLTGRILWPEDATVGCGRKLQHH